MKIGSVRAIVTGAGSGFGRAIAKCLASEGAMVAGLDINSESLTSLATESPEIKTFNCDVSDNQQVERTVDEVFDALGGLEVLVNNAGIMKNAPLVNLLQKPDRRHPLDLWHQVIAVNQSSVFFMTRSVVDRMISRRNRGVIVSISSIAARGNIGQTAYSASKAAVEAMTRVWAKELGSFGIRAVAVAPGFMDTAGAAAAIEEKMLKRWVDQTPLRRTGTVEEIVVSCKFAVENDFLNGETLMVNGGLVL